MTCTMCYPMQSHHASASYANATSCCAKIAALDAIIMASIIICGLISLSILGIVLVLLVVLLPCGKVNMPWARGFLEGMLIQQSGCAERYSRFFV